MQLYPAGKITYFVSGLLRVSPPGEATHGTAKDASQSATVQFFTDNPELAMTEATKMGFTRIDMVRRVHTEQTIVTF